MTVAAFDFDGTLTIRDSMFAFIGFVKGKARLAFGMLWLLPMLIQFKLGKKDRQAAKEQLLYHFLGKMQEEKLKEKAVNFHQSLMPRFLRTEMMERLAWHQAQGHHCLLVSASLDLWLAPFAEQHGLQLLSTQAHFKKGIYQQHFASPNCYGSEKVKRIQAALEGQPVEYIYAYGDSNGDKQMLAWADEGKMIAN